MTINQLKGKGIDICSCSLQQGMWGKQGIASFIHNPN